MKESDHQIALVKWVKYHLNYTIFHIPNGGYRTFKEGLKFKAMGVLAGVPDLYILELKLFIEMKKSKNEKLSKAQQKFKQKAIECGYGYIEAYGFKDGIEKIKEVINDD